MSQASAQSTTSINAPGGSIIKNSPTIWIAVILAVVIIAVVWLKRK